MTDNQLREACIALSRELRLEEHVPPALQSQLHTLEAFAQRIRDEALEQAAQISDQHVCDDHEDCKLMIADDIRALKSTAKGSDNG